MSEAAFAEAGVTGVTGTGQVARIEGGGIPHGTLVDAARIKDLLTRHQIGPAPSVRVLPVVNMDEYYHTDSYEVTDRLRTLLELRDGSCTWAFCTRRARYCDCDHGQPWKEDEHGYRTGGATCACAMSSLCRTHHRMKTHHQNAGLAKGAHNVWAYDNLGGGDIVWTGPSGIRLLRTNHGTYDYSENRTSHGARPRGFVYDTEHNAALSANVRETHQRVLGLKSMIDYPNGRALEQRNATTNRSLVGAECGTGPAAAKTSDHQGSQAQFDQPPPF